MKKHTLAYAICLLSITCWTIPSFGALPSFQPLASFSTGLSKLIAISTADFNGDGNPDVVTYGGINQNSLLMLLGNGDGTLQTPQNINIPISPNIVTHPIAVGDFNADGKPDIVTVVSDLGGTTSGISLLIGKGDGTFNQGASIKSGLCGVYNDRNNPVAVTTADINNDGKLDIVTGDQTGIGCSHSAVEYYIGNGDGTFKAPSTLDSGGNSFTNDIATADLNGDHIIDIVSVAELPSIATIYIGKGGGAFEPAASYTVGDRPVAVAVADLNGDGKPDIVTANQSANTVTILMGNGDGTFKSQQNYSVGNLPLSVSVDDINGDGAPDIIAGVQETQGGLLDILSGNGDGTFQTKQELAATGAGEGLFSVLDTDINKDGILDFVTGSFNSTNATGAVNVLLGVGSTSNPTPSTGSTSNPNSHASGSTPSAGGGSGGGGGGVANPLVLGFFGVVVAILRTKNRK